MNGGLCIISACVYRICCRRSGSQDECTNTHLDVFDNELTLHVFGLITRLKTRHLQRSGMFWASGVQMQGCFIMDNTHFM